MSSMEDTNTPYLRVRFEDIFHSDTPEDVFNKITDFIGLPRVDVGDRFTKPENKAQRDEFPDWHNWTHRQCAVLQDLCGNGMKQYGYGGEPDWLEKINPKNEAAIQ